MVSYVLKKIIVDNLSSFIETDFVLDLNLLISGNALELTNLKLKKSILPSWFPLELVHGEISKVIVKLPLFSLGSNPTHVIIEDIKLLVRIKQGGDTNGNTKEVEESYESLLLERKKGIIKQLEKIYKSSSSSSTAVGNNQSKAKLKEQEQENNVNVTTEGIELPNKGISIPDIVKQILRNLNLHIGNVHIRLEDIEENDRCNAMGFFIQNLDLETTDEYGYPTFDKSLGTNFKQLEIANIGAYVDGSTLCHQPGKDESIVEDEQHIYILAPLSLKLNFAIQDAYPNPKQKVYQPKVHFRLITSPVILELTVHQINSISQAQERCIDWLNNINQMLEVLDKSKKLKYSNVQHRKLCLDFQVAYKKSFLKNHKNKKLKKQYRALLIDIEISDLIKLTKEIIFDCTEVVTDDEEFSSSSSSSDNNVIDAKKNEKSFINTVSRFKKKQQQQQEKIDNEKELEALTKSSSKVTHINPKFIGDIYFPSIKGLLIMNDGDSSLDLDLNSLVLSLRDSSPTIDKKEEEKKKKLKQQHLDADNPFYSISLNQTKFHKTSMIETFISARVIEAKHLNATTGIYVKITYNNETALSKPQARSKNPIWNEHFVFQKFSNETDEELSNPDLIKIEVFSSRTMFQHTCIGTSVIDINTLLIVEDGKYTAQKELWLKLHKPIKSKSTAKSFGSIRIVLSKVLNHQMSSTNDEQEKSSPMDNFTEYIHSLARIKWNERSIGFGIFIQNITLSLTKYFVKHKQINMELFRLSNGLNISIGLDRLGLLHSIVKQGIINEALLIKPIKCEIDLNLDEIYCTFDAEALDHLIQLIPKGYVKPLKERVKAADNFRWYGATIQNEDHDESIINDNDDFIFNKSNVNLAMFKRKNVEQQKNHVHHIHLITIIPLDVNINVSLSSLKILSLKAFEEQLDVVKKSTTLYATNAKINLAFGNDIGTSLSGSIHRIGLDQHNGNVLQSSIGHIQTSGVTVNNDYKNIPQVKVQLSLPFGFGFHWDVEDRNRPKFESIEIKKQITSDVVVNVDIDSLLIETKFLFQSLPKLFIGVAPIVPYIELPPFPTVFFNSLTINLKLDTLIRASIDSYERPGSRALELSLYTDATYSVSSENKIEQISANVSIGMMLTTLRAITKTFKTRKASNAGIENDTSTTKGEEGEEEKVDDGTLSGLTKLNSLDKQTKRLPLLLKVAAKLRYAVIRRRQLDWIVLHHILKPFTLEALIMQQSANNSDLSKIEFTMKISRIDVYLWVDDLAVILLLIRHSILNFSQTSAELKVAIDIASADPITYDDNDDNESTNNYVNEFKEINNNAKEFFENRLGLHPFFSEQDIFKIPYENDQSAKSFQIEFKNSPAINISITIGAGNLPTCLLLFYTGFNWSSPNLFSQTSIDLLGFNRRFCEWEPIVESFEFNTLLKLSSKDLSKGVGTITLDNTRVFSNQILQLTLSEQSVDQLVSLTENVVDLLQLASIKKNLRVDGTDLEWNLESAKTTYSKLLHEFYTKQRLVSLIENQDFFKRDYLEKNNNLINDGNVDEESDLYLLSNDIGLPIVFYKADLNKLNNLDDDKEEEEEGDDIENQLNQRVKLNSGEKISFNFWPTIKDKELHILMISINNQEPFLLPLNQAGNFATQIELTANNRSLDVHFSIGTRDGSQMVIRLSSGAKIINILNNDLEILICGGLENPEWRPKVRRKQDLIYPIEISKSLDIPLWAIACNCDIYIRVNRTTNGSIEETHEEEKSDNVHFEDWNYQPSPDHGWAKLVTCYCLPFNGDSVLVFNHHRFMCLGACETNLVPQLIKERVTAVATAKHEIFEDETKSLENNKVSDNRKKQLLKKIRRKKLSEKNFSELIKIRLIPYLTIENALPTSIECHGYKSIDSGSESILDDVHFEELKFKIDSMNTLWSVPFNLKRLNVDKNLESGFVDYQLKPKSSSIKCFGCLNKNNTATSTTTTTTALSDQRIIKQPSKLLQLINEHLSGEIILPINANNSSEKSYLSICILAGYNFNTKKQHEYHVRIAIGDGLTLRTSCSSVESLEWGERLNFPLSKFGNFKKFVDEIVRIEVYRSSVFRNKAIAIYDGEVTIGALFDYKLDEGILLQQESFRNVQKMLELNNLNDTEESPKLLVSMDFMEHKQQLKFQDDVLNTTKPAPFNRSTTIGTIMSDASDISDFDDFEDNNDDVNDEVKPEEEEEEENVIVVVDDGEEKNINIQVEPLEKKGLPSSALAKDSVDGHIPIRENEELSLIMDSLFCFQAPISIHVNISFTANTGFRIILYSKFWLKNDTKMSLALNSHRHPVLCEKLLQPNETCSLLSKSHVNLAFVNNDVEKTSSIYKLHLSESSMKERIRVKFEGYARTNRFANPTLSYEIKKARSPFQRTQKISISYDLYFYNKLSTNEIEVEAKSSQDRLKLFKNDSLEPWRFDNCNQIRIRLNDPLTEWSEFIDISKSMESPLILLILGNDGESRFIVRVWIRETSTYTGDSSKRFNSTSSKRIVSIEWDEPISYGIRNFTEHDVSISQHGKESILIPVPKDGEKMVHFGWINPQHDLKLNITMDTMNGSFIETSISSLDKIGSQVTTVSGSSRMYCRVELIGSTRVLAISDESSNVDEMEQDEPYMIRVRVNGVKGLKTPRGIPLDTPFVRVSCLGTLNTTLPKSTPNSILVPEETRKQKLKTGSAIGEVKFLHYPLSFGSENIPKSLHFEVLLPVKSLTEDRANLCLAEYTLMLDKFDDFSGEHNLGWLSLSDDDEDLFINLDLVLIENDYNDIQGNQLPRHMDFSFAGVGLSLVKAKTNIDLSYFALRNLYASILNEKVITIRVGHIQVDNQRTLAQNPVVIIPNVENVDVLQICLKSKSIDHFEACDIILQELSIKLDEEFISDILEVFASLIIKGPGLVKRFQDVLVELDRSMEISLALVSSSIDQLQDHVTKDVTSSTAAKTTNDIVFNTGNVFIKHLHVYALKTTVTFFFQGLKSEYFKDNTSLGSRQSLALFRAFIAGFGKWSDVVIRFDDFDITNFYGRFDQLQWKLINHFSKIGLTQTYKGIFALDILGNPQHLVERIFTSLIDFLVTPILTLHTKDVYQALIFTRDAAASLGSNWIAAPIEACSRSIGSVASVIESINKLLGLPLRAISVGLERLQLAVQFFDPKYKYQSRLRRPRRFNLLGLLHNYGEDPREVEFYKNDKFNNTLDSDEEAIDGKVQIIIPSYEIETGITDLAILENEKNRFKIRHSVHLALLLVPGLNIVWIFVYALHLLGFLQWF